MITVETPLGKLKGFRKADLAVFRGVPFAMPAVGDLRFREPVPVEPWAGQRDALQYGPISLQRADPMALMVPGCEWNFYHPGAEQSEDCLYLNIWAPTSDQARPRPVLVWIHGGAWLAGSGSGLWCDGTHLASEEDVVVVTVNYRLGALGGLLVRGGTTSVNRMLADQACALRWVQENISAFGGDPGRVTVGGQSAGAFSVIKLMTAPEARGTFQRVIAQSGHADSAMTTAHAAGVRQQFLDELGLPQTTGTSVLASIDPERLMTAQDAVVSRVFVPFRPVVDYAFCPAPTLELFVRGGQAPVPLLIGTNADENNLFAAMQWGPGAPRGSFREGVRALFHDAPSSAISELSEAYLAEGQDDPAAWSALATDRDWRRPARALAGAHASSGAPVYMYEFAYKSTAMGGALGACHGLEVPFVFGNLDQPGVGDFVGAAERDRVARGAARGACVEAWGAFIRAGAPSSARLPTWDPYTAGDPAMMTIAAEPRACRDPYRDRLAYWDNLPAVAILGTHDTGEMR